MHVVAVEIEIWIPASGSLKDRRQVVRALLDGARRRFEVSAAEVGGQDTWQRATLGFAIVSSDARVASETVDVVGRAEVGEGKRMQLVQRAGPGQGVAGIGGLGAIFPLLVGGYLVRCTQACVWIVGACQTP